MQCPPVDFILLSHLHADHFDQLVEEKMRKDVPIVSTPHACERLVDKGFTALHALETWQEIEVRKGDERVTITAMPAKHTVATFEKVNELLGALPPVMGSIVKFTSEGRTFSMYISGDTLYYDDLKVPPFFACLCLVVKSSKVMAGDPHEVPGDQPGTRASGRHDAARDPRARHDGRRARDEAALRTQTRNGHSHPVCAVPCAFR